MIKKSDLIKVIEYQSNGFNLPANEIERDLLASLPVNITGFALIISGIRRCGKSTLLQQLIKREESNMLFLNFDTPKLYNFELNDFEILDLIIDEAQSKSLFFDEIQVVNGWELYVRQKLDQGYKVVVTGSNASLLSQELGTKLTGRHISKELFPFSFQEYVRFKTLPSDGNSFNEYLSTGGFPEFVRTSNPDVLPVLFNDILYRDIAVRYGIRDVESLKRLLVYLISNVGSLVTASKLVTIMGIKSSATILDYFSYFEQSYLLHLMPKFSYSYRSQLVNPRKIYIIDNGLVNAISASFSDNTGRKFENAVFYALRQKTKELFYFNEHGAECDFVVCTNHTVKQLIQVCYELNPENMAREERGLLAAMDFFNLTKGKIITLNQNDIIRVNNKTIEVVRVFDYFNSPEYFEGI